MTDRDDPSLLERLRRLLDVPTQLDNLRETLVSNLDTLKAAVQRNGEATASAVTSLADLRTKLAALQQANEAGQVDQAELAAITASLDASTDSIAQALAPVVEDDDTPTGDVEAPAPTNPETVDPGSVEGSVPAGESLPEQS